MPRISQVMIAYGMLLLACEVIALVWNPAASLRNWLFFSGWSIGPLMIATGLSAAQGRRSIRLCGFIIGTILPLVMGILLAWITIRSGPSFFRVVSGGLALASLVAFVLVLRLRPREGVASRGYAVVIPQGRRAAQVSTEFEQQRSEAG